MFSAARIMILGTRNMVQEDSFRIQELLGFRFFNDVFGIPPSREREIAYSIERETALLI